MHAGQTVLGLPPNRGLRASLAEVDLTVASVLKSTDIPNLNVPREVHCERFALKPLEFDGTSDAVYHPFDRDGNRHMEYLAYRGEFRDVPIDRIRETFRSAYAFDRLEAGLDFDADVNQEVPPS